MRKRWSVLALAVLALALQSVIPASRAAAADGTTQYRVYQNDKALREFAGEAQAIAFAKGYAYSHVEKIAGRLWMWDNFPRYQVYENGVTGSGRQFRTLAEAKALAKTLRFPQIRDLQQPGWISGAYPQYRMYQGDKTLPDWSYATLAEAKTAAKAYSNIHIVELSTNQWIWDNLSAAQKAAQRQAAPVYEIDRNGAPVGAERYSFLLDAMRAAAGTPGSRIVNTATGNTVFDTAPAFTVTQNGRAVRSFASAGGAIGYAKTLAGAAVVNGDLEWWTNVPFLTVKQGDRAVRSFFTRAGAVQFAAGYSDSSVVTADGHVVWSNGGSLQILGWNGESDSDAIEAQLSQTQGLDLDSPWWFELADADGTLTDLSDPALAASLKQSGLKVVPLLSNNFDTKTTTAFLRDAGAQSRFIDSLVGRLSELGVYGLNLDFESLAGGDRARYTAFVRSLAEAAHKKGLKVSIDLPRGDVAWDALTAYDHTALAGIVDTIVIMAYDEYWEGSEQAGSVAELSWAEDGVRQFLAYGIPRSKLMLGIPFYVRDWRLDASGNPLDSKAIFMDQVPSLIKQQGAVGVYDPSAGQTKYTYSLSGYTHVFWAETNDTVKARVAIAKKYDLAGVAAWRLGYESADLWTMLLRQK